LLAHLYIEIFEKTKKASFYKLQPKFPRFHLKMVKIMTKKLAEQLEGAHGPPVEKHCFNLFPLLLAVGHSLR